jgi:hypothetical protein
MSNVDVNLDDFEDVRKGGTLWEPKSTGKKKDQTFKELAPSDDAWVMGFYMGREDGKGPKQNSTVHYLKLGYSKDKALVGNAKHLSGDPKETSDNISIWGTGVLNGNLAEGVKPGEFIRIKWLGKAVPKKGGDPYHNWEVSVNKKVTPMAVQFTAADSSPLDEEFMEDKLVAEDLPSQPQVEDFNDDDLL